MLVLEPLDRGSMNFDVAAVCDGTNLDGGVAEIGSAVGVECSGIKNAHGPTVSRS